MHMRTTSLKVCCICQMKNIVFKLYVSTRRWFECMAQRTQIATRFTRKGGDKKDNSFGQKMAEINVSNFSIFFEKYFSFSKRTVVTQFKIVTHFAKTIFTRWSTDTLVSLQCVYHFTYLIYNLFKTTFTEETIKSSTSNNKHNAHF